MIESVKARWTIIITILVVSMVWVTPNFVNLKAHKMWWPQTDEINMGLDIQGGLHLVMGVDVQEVIVEKIARMVRNIKKQLTDEAIAVTQVEVMAEDKTRFVVGVTSLVEANKVTDFLEKQYPGVLQVLSADTNQVLIRYYENTVIEYKKQTIEQAIEVIRNRVDEFGVAEPSITAQGDNRILVQLPGLEDAVRAKELINKTAKLNFHQVSTEVPVEQLSTWITEAEAKGKYKLGKPDKEAEKMEGAEEAEQKLAYSAYIKKLNEDLESKIPKNTILVFEKLDAAVTLEAGRRPYLLSTDGGFTGDLLESANVTQDQYGRPEVTFRFSVEGRRQFAALTDKAKGGFIAIVLDNVIKSAPSVKEKINSDSARITLGSGDFQKMHAEASLIATALRAGALPAALQQLEERTVGPTLGADAISKGKKAGIIGSFLVLIFMLIYYRFLGFVANMALAFNVLLILAVLTSLGATLTLPGVAGIVLTVGMAVDANVIIFERIKEELRRGIGVRSAVKEGFGHAFSAIFDANITTAAVCVVLMYYGTGPVRGFAVTLMSGVLTSMFTSIFFSRSVIELSINKFGVNKLVKV